MARCRCLRPQQLFQTLRTAHPHDRFLPYVVPENWADHLERRHPAAALAALRMNVELYPDHPSTHRGLGTTLLAAGDTAKGEQLRKAVELGPNDAETLDRLAMLEASRQPLALHLPDTLSLAIDVTDPGDPHIGRAGSCWRVWERKAARFPRNGSRSAHFASSSAAGTDFGPSPSTTARRPKYDCNARTAW